MSIDQQKDQLDKWADMWDQAQEKGIFDDGPGLPTPSPHTSNDSFFGLQNTHPTDTIQDSDAKYWADLHNTPELGGVKEDELLQEATDRGQSWTDPKAQNKKYPPNPLRVDSGGEDQKLEPQQLGVTFDEKDIEELIDIKNRLHELENKMIATSMTGNSTKTAESRIESLKKKLDELSSAMGYGLPNDVAANVKAN